MSGEDPAAPGAQAGRERIAALEAEVSRLRAEVADSRLAADLREHLTQVGALGELRATDEHHVLLEQIVGTAMAALRAGAGSLYLADQDGESLIFEVALGGNAEALIGRRLPIGQGIAGWVATTGQAIAIGDVQRDPRWSQEFGSSVGYAPKTMLVAPLLVNDEVIGVLQLLDKEGGATFGAADMQLFGLFAQQAAVAIAQSRALRDLSGLVRLSLADLGDAGDLAGRVAALAARTEGGGDYRDTLELARLLGRLARTSEAGRGLALGLIGTIVAFLDTQADAGRESWMVRG